MLSGSHASFDGHPESWCETQRGEILGIQQSMQILLEGVQSFCKQQQHSTRENLANVQHSISESQGATDQFKDGFAIRSGDLLESVLQPLIDQLYQQISCHTATISLFTRDLRKQVMDHGHFVSQYVAGQQDKLSALSSAIMEENANQVPITGFLTGFCQGAGAFMG